MDFPICFWRDGFVWATWYIPFSSCSTNHDCYFKIIAFLNPLKLYLTYMMLYLTYMYFNYLINTKLVKESIVDKHSWVQELSVAEN